MTKPLILGATVGEMTAWLSPFVSHIDVRQDPQRTRFSVASGFYISNVEPSHLLIISETRFQAACAMAVFDK